MAKWIMKINPESNFRITECLNEIFARDGILALENKQCDPQVGDILYLYQIGKGYRGLCGVSIVTSPSQPREQPECQQRYNQAPYDPSASRLLVRIERFAETPVKIPSWRPNAGTTQRCPTKYAEEFDKAAQALQTVEDFSVSAEQYRTALLDWGSTDRETRKLARVEQSYWRNLLFGRTAKLCTCAVCGQQVPRDLIVVAHIKRRHQCDHEERLDPNNVMPACLLGCDALFEKRYITVQNGRIVSRQAHDLSPTVRECVQRLNGKRLHKIEWTEQRELYFTAHSNGPKD